MTTNKIGVTEIFISEQTDTGRIIQVKINELIIEHCNISD